MRIQEVVDTINKLRRESTPDYKSVDGQARKDGLDSRFARLLEGANLAFTLVCFLAKAARTGAARPTRSC